jgi:hypothetical protein
MKPFRHLKREFSEPVRSVPVQSGITIGIKSKWIYRKFFESNNTPILLITPLKIHNF